MPYAAPATVSAGQIYTPTMYNTYLQGNADSGYMRMIADSTASGAVASFDFTSIVQTFAHLMLVCYLRGDTAATTTTISLRLNNDSAADYDYQLVTGNAAVASAAETLAGTSIGPGSCPAASATANVFNHLVVDLAHYTNAINNKSLNARNANKAGTGSGNLAVTYTAGFWRSNAAITRITIAPAAGNFVAGSRATLYGMPA